MVRDDISSFVITFIVPFLSPSPFSARARAIHILSTSRDSVPFLSHDSSPVPPSRTCPRSVDKERVSARPHVRGVTSQLRSSSSTVVNARAMEALSSSIPSIARAHSSNASLARVRYRARAPLARFEPHTTINPTRGAIFLRGVSTASATNASSESECARERALRWYEKGKSLPNVFTARTSEEFMAFLHAAANFARRKRSGARAKCVCVKYFAPDCPSCRSLAPKFEKLCEREFADVVFLKVNVRDFADVEFMEKLNVPALPYVQIYSGSQGLVAEFPTSLNAKNLERLRAELEAWRENDGLASQGVAEVVEAPGWPERATQSLRESSRWAFKRMMMLRQKTDTDIVDVA